jgi:hypothetical protein
MPVGGIHAGFSESSEEKVSIVSVETSAAD